MKSRTSHSGIEAASGLIPQMLASDAARELADDRTSPKEYFDRLMNEALHTDALQVLPHLMPKPVAVWWGCLCTWEASRPDPPAPVDQVLEATLRWLVDPSETNRRALEEPMENAGCGTAAGCVAAAACYSEGSMSAPGLPAVLPPPHLTARLIAAAVLLAAAAREPHRCVERHREMLALGLEVAQGKILCPWGARVTESPVAAGEAEDPLRAVLAAVTLASAGPVEPTHSGPSQHGAGEDRQGESQNEPTAPRE